MDLKEVQGFIDQNKSNADVQKFIGSFVNADRVNSFLDSDEGGKLIQPRVDKHFTKGLETWKEKNLPTVIEEEIKKRKYKKFFHKSLHSFAELK